MRIGSKWALLDRLTRGRFCTRVRTGERALYITFDDGPHPRHTPDLLKLLARFDALATFFMVGKSVVEHPEIAAQVAQAGHCIGNHSYSHARQTKIRATQRSTEVRQTDTILQGVDGRVVHPFRPPYGSIPVRTAASCLLGFARIALWSYDSLDHRGNPADVIRRMSADAMRPGEVLLFHDDADTALQALSHLLPLWQQQGFSFMALE
jgi:peptidoglycan/xylan/chitin deacetylase (PgdA/CDA1 family)